MNIDEFVDYYNMHKPPSPDFPAISADDIKQWVEQQSLHPAPYYRSDIHTVYDLLKRRSELQEAEPIPRPRKTGREMPECLEWWDGESLELGEKCPECGRVGKAEPVLEPGWEERVRSQLFSLEFQEKVILARRVLDIPDSGWPQDEAINRLLCAHIAAACSYSLSLERFQRLYLSLDEEARAEHLQPFFGGKWAKFIARLTMPASGRAESIEWLLACKLIAARLCSLLGQGKVTIDNVSDMFLYIVCPELKPFDSWELRPVGRGQDPWQRQFDSFLHAVSLLPDENKGRKQSRTVVATALKLTFDFLEGKVSFDECRRAYAAAFPFLIPESIDPTSTAKMRAHRAAKKFPYQWILKAARSLLRW